MVQLFNALRRERRNWKRAQRLHSRTLTRDKVAIAPERFFDALGARTAATRAAADADADVPPPPPRSKKAKWSALQDDFLSQKNEANWDSDASDDASE